MEEVITVDLADCDIGITHYMTYSHLKLVQILTLSDYRIHTANWSLSNSSNLRMLNLSCNKIERLERDMIKQLREIGKDRVDTKTLWVDLTGNPLICLCNATRFVQSIQSSEINYANSVNYTCLYINNSILPVLSVDFGKFNESCQIINTLTNYSECPCDTQRVKHLYNIRASLVHYYCTAESGDVVRLGNLDQIMRSRICPTILQKPVFIFSVTVGSALIFLLIMFVIFLILYKRH